MKQVCVVRLCHRGPKSSFSPNLGVRRTVTVANTTHAMDITLFDDHVQSCPFVNGEAVMSFVDVRVEEWAGGRRGVLSRSGGAAVAGAEVNEEQLGNLLRDQGRIRDPTVLKEDISFPRRNTQALRTNRDVFGAGEQTGDRQFTLRCHYTPFVFGDFEAQPPFYWARDGKVKARVSLQVQDEFGAVRMTCFDAALLTGVGNDELERAWQACVDAERGPAFVNLFNQHAFRTMDLRGVAQAAGGTAESEPVLVVQAVKWVAAMGSRPRLPGGALFLPGVWSRTARAFLRFEAPPGSFAAGFVDAGSDDEIWEDFDPSTEPSTASDPRFFGSQNTPEDEQTSGSPPAKVRRVE